jgi:prepilin-type N-terminal cleavage/methylation domain-containing protein
MTRVHPATWQQALRRLRLRRQGSSAKGFTLLELLAALAIGAVILAAVAALVRNVALNFDRGTRTVNEGEHLLLAVERLAADIGGARFVTVAGAATATVAFFGEGAGGGESGKLVFVGPGGIGSSRKGEEVVGLTVEQDGDVARLVRRSAPWPGPRTRLEDVMLDDPVTLLEGNLLFEFSFGHLSDGAVAWSDAWKSQQVLPRFVRLRLRNRATGVDVMAPTDFVIRADASGSCGQANGSGCLSAGTKARKGHDDTQ